MLLGVEEQDLTGLRKRVESVPRGKTGPSGSGEEGRNSCCFPACDCCTVAGIDRESSWLSDTELVYCCQLIVAKGLA